MKPTKAEISAVMSELGKRSASKMTKEQRIERARKAGLSKKKKPLSTPLSDN